MHTVGKVLVLSVSLFVACATTSADPGPRLSALEERLTRLEERLAHAPDASESGAPVEPDASVPVANVSRRATPGPWDAGDPVQRLADCKKDIERRCTHRIAQARAEQERARKKGFGWIDHSSTPALDSTPAGRACLEQESKTCERLVERDKQLEWLDAQLVPGKRDEKITKEIRERVAGKLGVPAESLDIACAAQFCRLGWPVPDAGHDYPFRFLGDEFGGGMQDGGGYWYALRRGYELLR
jgi:hypothetical protein